PQSGAYQARMHRLVALIAVLFCFAAVLGPTVAHAHRYVSTPIVVLNHVDEANRSIPVVVDIQRGQIDLGAGISMPCGPYHAIGVNIPALPLRQASAAPEQAPASDTTAWFGTRLLRPPISA